MCLAGIKSCLEIGKKELIKQPLLANQKPPTSTMFGTTTGNSLNNPPPQEVLSLFQVNDVHVRFTSTPNQAKKMYELFQIRRGLDSYLGLDLHPYIGPSK